MKAQTHEYLAIFCLFMIWWAGNAAYAIDAHNVLREMDAPWLYLDLAFFQIIVGALMPYAYLKIQSSQVKISASGELRVDVDSIEQDPESDSNIRKRKALFSSRVMLFAGAVHFAGTVLTNASYKLLGSTSTLVWKLSEPFAVVLLKAGVLGDSTSLLSMIGVAHIVLGVLIFSWTRKTVLATSPILIANIAYPIRNVLVKLDQKKNETKKSAVEAYLSLTAATLPFAISALVIKVSFIPLPLYATSRLIRNAILFNAYQFASIGLLQRLDTLTHAVGNTLKRFTAILMSVVYRREMIGMVRIKGLLLTSIGFSLYSIGGSTFNAYPHTVRRIGILSAFASVALTLHTLAATIRIPYYTKEAFDKAWITYRGVKVHYNHAA